MAYREIEENGVVVSGTGGGDEIINDGYWDVTIDAGDGNDSIRNSFDYYDYDDDEDRSVNVSISGGGGNDSITNNGHKVTINGDAGNDTVENSNADNVIINGGAGKDVISNYNSSYVTISGGDGNDSIDNKGSSVTIDGGDDNDYIVNSSLASNVSIVGGAGNDSIFNYDHSSNVTINGGEGDDTVENNSENVLINAGTGNNSVFNSAMNVTIESGAGDDTIDNSGINFLLKYGGGNDIIEGFNSSSTLQIMSSDSITSGLLNGNDAVLTIGGNKVTLKGVGNISSINVMDAAGNEKTFNITVNKSITGTAQSDSIKNSLDDATIDALGGDDTVENNANNVSINTGAGNDSIDNGGSSVTIDGGAGNDSIYNRGSNTSINGGAGNDTVTNDPYTENVLFQYNAGDGNDVIEGFNTSSTLQIMSGSIQSVSWSGSDAVLKIGDNTVTLKDMSNRNRINIINSAGNSETFILPVTISGTNNADEIRNTDTSDATIDALGGNDTVENSGENILISGGAGRDTISNFGKNSTIDGGADNDSISNNADNVIIKGDAGNDTVRNSDDYRDGGNSVTIDGGDGDDFIQNYNYYGGNVVSISGGAGNDRIENGDKETSGGSNVTISGDADKDNITNVNGNNVTISGGDDNDTIQNGLWAEDDNENDISGGNNVLLDGGADDDFIDNVNGKNVSIIGGAGNDVIYNSGNDATINGGAGTNVITNYHSNGEEYYEDEYGKRVTFQYSGGNDVINGFDETSTLQIGTGNDSYSTTKSGNDIIVTVGNGKITLVGAAALSEVHVSGEEVDLFPAWRLNGTTATYGTKSNTLVTVIGVKNTDGITINDKTVTLPLSALNNSNVSISDGYTLALANDVAAPQMTAAHFSGTTYKSASSTEGYTLADNKITYTAAKAETDLFTINGVQNTNGITLNGTTVTVPLAALGSSNVSVSDGYTLALANDVKAPQPIAEGWSGLTYKSAGNTGGYTLDDYYNEIIYTAAEPATDLFTISGVKNTNGISVDTYYATVTVPLAALGTSNVTVTNGYSLEIADDVKAPTTAEAGWTYSNNVATYKNVSTTAGYELTNNQIVYTAANGGETLVTVSGVKTANGLNLSGTAVTIPLSALNQNAVTISDGYILKLDTDVPISTSTAAGWKLEGTTATYKNAETTAGYKLDSNKITYNAASGGNIIVTVGGVKSTKGLAVDATKKVVTVANKVLNKKTVTISNGYTLDLANDVTAPTTTAAGWTLNGKNAVYKNAAVTAGYKLVKNQIVYNATSGGKTLATVSGVKSTDGLSIKGKVVTVKASALGTGKVTISDGYKISLGSDVAKPKTTKAWSFKDSAATYTRTTTAGYTLASNAKSVTYSKSATKNLITVDGVKSKDGLSVKGKVVTVSKAALGTDKVTVSKGYKLALGSDVVKPKTTAATWTHNKTTATYKSSSKTEGYTLANNSITYSSAKATSTLATVTGIKSDATPAVKGNVITLTKANLSSNKVTVTGNDYEFNFAEGDYKKTAVTGSAKADVITSSGKNLSITGGKGDDTVKVLGSATTVIGGAGNDSIVSNGKNNVFVYGNDDGNDVITNFTEKDKIKITKGTADIKINGKDVIFTIGKSKVTVKGGVGKTITYVDGKGEHTYPKPGVSLSGASVNLLKNFLEDDFNIADYGDTLQTINAAAVVHDISITGNKLMNKITGGAGNDTLIGGKGNDNLTGGEGSDVFVYANGDGNDVITDYSSDDRIKITKGTATVKKNGKDVIFTVGTGKITVKDAADKVVTYIDAKGKTNYYPKPTKDSVIINGTSVTVLEEYKSDTFDVGNVKNGNKVKMIDATSVSRNLKIIGNAKANVILGGYGNDTLYGGKNNDTLQGGDGKDIFVYESGDGNDVIVDYTSDDTIKIAKGTAKVTTKGSDVVFTIGSGKMTVQNAAGKTITYIEGDKKKTYSSAPAFIADDDNYELTPNLSSLIQSKSADYSFLNTSTKLTKENKLIAYTDKK